MTANVSLVPTHPRESPAASSDLGREIDELGESMHQLVRRLYPICRSITGDGVRRTLEIINEHIPLTVHEVPTGTQVLDWTVPQEWNIRDAYIKDRTGRKVVDFNESPLHVMGYSVPVDARLPLSVLRGHLHTLPSKPDVIPYRTGYYSNTWGFCIAENVLKTLEEGDYDVRIDSTLVDGSLTYAEHVVPGTVPGEVLVACHTCHPALANETLAGIAVAVQLARLLAQKGRRLTYRFLFAPTTIGSIVWLARNRDRVGLIEHGLVLACAGDSAPLRYKRSRRGNALIDRAAAYALRNRDHTVVDFTPYGYDERQFCSPGFNLPVGLLTRSPNEEYPEYHTSADNPDIVSADSLSGTLAAMLDIMEVLDGNQVYLNLQPYGEPQLGKRGLYRPYGSNQDEGQHQMAIQWVLNYCDGEHSLLDIAERSGISFSVLSTAVRALIEANLLAESE